jgi:hypothetical protein
MTDWSSEAILEATESARSMFELLSKPDFHRKVNVSSIPIMAVHRFNKVLDEDEAQTLESYFSNWFFDEHPLISGGVTLLHQILLASTSKGTGSDSQQSFQLLANKLVAFRPNWFLKWYRYAAVIHDDSERVTSAILDAQLSAFDRSNDCAAGFSLMTEIAAANRARDWLVVRMNWIGDVTRHVYDRADQRKIDEPRQSVEQIIRAEWRYCDEYSENNKSGNAWYDGFEEFPKILKMAATDADALSKHTSSYGFSFARRASHVDGIAAEIAKLLPAAVKPPELLQPCAAMWWNLRKIAEHEKSYGHQIEIIGLRSNLRGIVAVSPSLWADALPWIFARRRECSDVILAITFELALEFEVVVDALKAACSHANIEIQLFAQGIASMLSKEGEPTTRTAVNALAALLDGDPSFPHPLALRSGTWLADRPH